MYDETRNRVFRINLDAETDQKIYIAVLAVGDRAESSHT